MELLFVLNEKGLKSAYEGARVFVCKDPNCQICVDSEKKKIEGAFGRELKLDVKLWGTRRPWAFGPKFWIAHIQKVIEVKPIKKIDEDIEFDAARSNLVVYRTPNGVIIVDPGSIGFECQSFSLRRFVAPEEKILAVIVTHGHQDHWNHLSEMPDNAPVFMGRITNEIALRHALLGHDIKLSRVVRRARILTPGSSIILNGSRVMPFPLPHTIEGTVGLDIRGPRARALHFGDFRLSGWDPTDKARTMKCLEELAQDPVDTVCMGVFNAHLEGFVPSESLVIESFIEIMAQSRGRLIVSCFSSNWARIGRIYEAARIMNRPVLFCGSGMRFAQQTLRIRNEDENSARAVIFVTGCQGEPDSVLWRIAEGKDSPLTLQPTDTLAFSSRAIPDNEPLVRKVAVRLQPKVGVLVLNVGEVAQLGLEGLGIQEKLIHVTGHENGGGLEHVILTLRPRDFLAFPQTSPQIGAVRALTEPLGIKIIPEDKRVIDV